MERLPETAARSAIESNGGCRQQSPGCASGEAPNDERRSFVDVLVLVAVPVEFEAILESRHMRTTDWQEAEDSAGFSYRVATFENSDGSRSFRTALARPPYMESVAATQIATRLIGELSPTVVAMAGVCAGRRGKVNYGDIVVADRVFKYDLGKRLDGRKDKREGFQYDVNTVPLDPRWLQALQDFRWIPSAELSETRPTPVEYQERWLRHAIMESDSTGVSPESHPERRSRCPNWQAALDRGHRSRRISRNGLSLTKRGEETVRRELERFPDGLPVLPMLECHVGPMATGSAVVEDPTVMQKIATFSRKVLALEMEAFAVGLTALVEGIPRFLVAKGVADFGDSDKDDGFQKFAGRASFEFCIDFMLSRPAKDIAGCEGHTGEEFPSRGRRIAMSQGGTDARPAALSVLGTLPVPDDVRDNALLESGAACPIPHCGQSSPLSLVFLDGDVKNHEPANLLVLCERHGSEASVGSLPPTFLHAVKEYLSRALATGRAASGDDVLVLNDRSAYLQAAVDGLSRTKRSFRAVFVGPLFLHPAWYFEEKSKVYGKVHFDPAVGAFLRRMSPESRNSIRIILRNATRYSTKVSELVPPGDRARFTKELDQSIVELWGRSGHRGPLVCCADTGPMKIPTIFDDSFLLTTRSTASTPVKGGTLHTGLAELKRERVLFDDVFRAHHRGQRTEVSALRAFVAQLWSVNS